MSEVVARDMLLIFGTVQRVMRVERRAREQALDVDVMPAPRSVSSECGVVLAARFGERVKVKGVLRELGLEAQTIYRRRAGSWTLASLEGDAQEEISLTSTSAYGGCGAKLSKGVLDSVLCGLPQLVSEDLIVGIEGADDAGVLRIDAETAIIHTTDFFPPMVDDPFSFGRIAAANALSDVYAMGGQPLAGLNLVSFPLEEYGKQTLKEILRGGLSALEEAGAVLAGGHTIEGRDLLYGLAVTGRVHPERIWQNGGARAGDLLVLGKPLGSGLVTTAAKAGLAKADHLTTAIRWMATLNQGAAAAARQADPHAVTDITGFGLAGHAAEMAAASGVEIVLHLTELPAMPGALPAAASGLVPAGAAKNRESLSSVLAIDEDADPLRVDLCLDPQTSGGLLIACAADRAEALVRRLAGSAIVGECREGRAGTLRLVSSRDG